MRLSIALTLLGGAQAQINKLKYTQVAPGACRGNGGPADKVSGVYTQGQTQEWCEQQCDLQPDCVGYAFHVGQSDPALAWCIVHSPTIAGSCSNPAIERPPHDGRPLHAERRRPDVPRELCGRRYGLRVRGRHEGRRSDGAPATMLGYGAIAAAALLA